MEQKHDQKESYLRTETNRLSKENIALRVSI